VFNLLCVCAHLCALEGGAGSRAGGQQRAGQGGAGEAGAHGAGLMARSSGPTAQGAQLTAHAPAPWPTHRRDRAMEENAMSAYGMSAGENILCRRGTACGLSFGGGVLWAGERQASCDCPCPHAQWQQHLVSSVSGVASLAAKVKGAASLPLWVGRCARGALLRDHGASTHARVARAARACCGSRAHMGVRQGGITRGVASTP